MRLHIKKTDKNIIKHEQCLSLNNEIMGHFNFLFFSFSFCFGWGPYLYFVCTFANFANFLIMCVYYIESQTKTEEKRTEIMQNGKH